ncbi:MAG: hypothetical protein U9R00_00330 [Patescibacteria group bacterium]|nr:hypothetical protein [Patescibacteria group bacterium]
MEILVLIIVAVGVVCLAIGFLINSHGSQMGKSNTLKIKPSSDSQILRVELLNPFDPKSFIGKDWSIDEEDEKSLKLTEIDLRKVILKTTLKDNENYVKGEENLKRLKNGKEILLNARVFQALWENQQLIPEEWKEKINEKRTYVFFDGTILQNSDGCRFVLCLYWNVRKWKWRYGWLEGVWFDNNPSAVLSNSTLNSETLVS